MHVKMTVYIKIMDKCLKLLSLTPAIELYFINWLLLRRHPPKQYICIFFPLGYLILSYQLISKDDNLS